MWFVRSKVDYKKVVGVAMTQVHTAFTAMWGFFIPLLSNTQQRSMCHAEWQQSNLKYVALVALESLDYQA